MYVWSVLSENGGSAILKCSWSKGCLLGKGGGRGAGENSKSGFVQIEGKGEAGSRGEYGVVDACFVLSANQVAPSNLATTLDFVHLPARLREMRLDVQA